MHRSFGMETRTESTLWEDVRRGPSKRAVMEHVAKIGGYQALVACLDGRQAADVVALRKEPAAERETMRLAA